MGYAPGTMDTDPRLENALQKLDGIVDGGASVAVLEDILDKLEALKAARQQAALNTEADTVAANLRVDPARGMLAMMIQGRTLVSELEALLDCDRKRDVFATFTG